MCWGTFSKLYIDDVVVKSKKKEDHIENLRTVFTRMRKQKLRMNPAKCIFGVRAEDFLGFIVHERGIEVAEDKAKAVLDTPAPRNKKELQSLLGKINFLRRFISNSAGKTAVFSPLLKLKADQEFQWGPTQQAAFDKIKEYLTHPPVLRPPRPGIPLKLYISASPYSIAGLIAHDGDGEGGKKVEHAVYYLSRTLLDAETRYSPIERLCLALYFAVYTLKGATGHAVSDFLLHHPIVEDIDDHNVVVSFVHTQPWVLYFDGSSTDHLSGAGVTLVNPSGVRHCYSFQLEWKCTNNHAEYEAIIIGLELLLDLEVTEVEVLDDSLLVINQLKGIYKCNNFALLLFLERASELLDQFADVMLDYIPRERNFAANELAQLATGIRLADGVRESILKVQRRTLPSFMARKEVNDEWLVAVIDTIDVDWRQSIIQYFTDPSAPVDKRVRYFATTYVLRGGELLRRPEDGLYLRCIYGAEAKRCLREVHCGNCGSHQAGPKMRWLIRRYDFYWPTMLKDCISFAQGCIECQMHGPVQHVPDVPLQPIIKPWLGRGWALDFIGEIHHNSSLQHKHILLATDFFTKWVEAIPVKTTSSEVITDFIFKYIITRYGIPKCLVADRGAGFMAEKTQKFLAGYGIKFLHSSPYYASEWPGRS
ncbi:uncharacterized protein LOC126783925 [Argentina anserina]|uniref:uncharacterized protein LOC126783925 n=1 Tax=Argentina anserina TaxID=57926 RepID=UPI0021767CAE|nr:uncharacterized protein LOC126783925 [Potentilla anserina]